MPGFTLGYFSPPIDYGIQSPAIGRGGPNMPSDAYARAGYRPWVPRWAATMLFNFAYPYGAASSKRTVPQAPNLWTAYTMPAANGIVKQSTNQQVF